MGAAKSDVDCVGAAESDVDGVGAAESDVDCVGAAESDVEGAVEVSNEGLEGPGLAAVLDFLWDFLGEKFGLIDLVGK